MSCPSDGAVVWSANHPVSRLQAAREAVQAARYHYARLLRTTLSGKDPLK